MRKTQTESPVTITVNQLASLANLTVRRIYQLGEEGTIPHAENGKLPMVESIKALFASYQRDGASLAKEKLLKCAAERKLREQEWAVADKKLMSTAVARATISEALRKYHQIVRGQLEKRDIQAADDFYTKLGLTDEQQAELYAFHLELARATTDKIEDTCAAIGRGQDPEQLGDSEAQTR